MKVATPELPPLIQRNPRRRLNGPVVGVNALIVILCLVALLGFLTAQPSVLLMTSVLATVLWLLQRQNDRVERLSDQLQQLCAQLEATQVPPAAPRIPERWSSEGPHD